MVCTVYISYVPNPRVGTRPVHRLVRNDRYVSQVPTDISLVSIRCKQISGFDNKRENKDGKT